MMHHNVQEPYFTDEHLNRYRHFVNQFHNQVNKLEEQVKEVEEFYQSTDVQQNDCKNKGKAPMGSKKPLRRASEETQEEVMRHFSKIWTEITQHKWAWPFLEPVDVEGLGLYDYYEIIAKPMDFGTIKRKMEAKDGSGYKNAREIYADVRLIFNNAMRYNDEKNNIHVMAKTLLEKFEKKWLNLLPKVVKAESEMSKEEAHMQLQKKLAQEATYANMTRELSTKLSKVDTALNHLKATMIAQCRKLSSQERLTLLKALSKLSKKSIKKALQIIYETNPNFDPNAEKVVYFDYDSQSDYTVWRLLMFVKKELDTQGEKSVVTHEDNNIEDEDKEDTLRKIKTMSSKEEEWCDSLAKDM